MIISNDDTFLNKSATNAIMSQDRISMPSGIGGLVRYFEDYKSKIEFKPVWVVVFIIAVMVIEILLHAKVFG